MIIPYISMVLMTLTKILTNYFLKYFCKYLSNISKFYLYFMTKNLTKIKFYKFLLKNGSDFINFVVKIPKI